METSRLIRPVRYGLCGILMGAGAVLPGVSGGVLAVVFGVYRPLMELLTRPRDALPRYGNLIPPLAAGWCLGFLGFAKGIAAAIGQSVTVTTWLFIGLIAGTLPALYREAGREGRDGKSWASLLLCAGAVSAVLFSTAHVLHAQAEPNCFWCAFCGALWGLSVSVPGLTSASIMMALGLYRPMLEGLARLDLMMFAAAVPAMVLAAVLPARAVTRLFRNHYSVTFHGILGIVSASTAAIVPVRYSGPGEAVLSALCCAGGFLLAFFLERLDRKLHTEEPRMERERR